jgi:hypothetical protein
LEVALAGSANAGVGKDKGPTDPTTIRVVTAAAKALVIRIEAFLLKEVLN